MIKALNQWALPKALSIEEAAKKTKALGFDALELDYSVDGKLGPDTTKSEARKVADAVRAAGLEVASVASAIGWEYNIASDNAGERKTATKHVKKMIQVAAWSGTDAILVIPGMVAAVFIDKPPVSYEAVWDRALAAFRDLAPFAEEHNVQIGLETVWNKFLLSPLEMRDFVDAVGSRCVRAYLDIGNVIFNGYPEQWIRILGKRICRLHAKDYSQQIGGLNGFVPLCHGDVNWPEVAKALREIGYEGYLIAELFPGGPHPDAQLVAASRAMDYILG